MSDVCVKCMGKGEVYSVAEGRYVSCSWCVKSAKVVIDRG